jgi:hypothetical protein
MKNIREVLTTLILLTVLVLLVLGGYMYFTGNNPLPSPRPFVPDFQPTITHPEATELPDARDESIIDAIVTAAPQWATVSDIFGDNPNDLERYIQEYGVRNRPAVFLVTNRADALGQGVAGQTTYNIFTRQEIKGGLLLEEAFVRVGLDYGILGDTILMDTKTHVESDTVYIDVTVHGCVVNVGIPITDLENPKPESSGDTLSEPSWWVQFRLWLKGEEYDSNQVRAVANTSASANALQQILAGNQLHQTFKESVETPGPGHANEILTPLGRDAAWQWTTSWCQENPDKICDLTKINVIVNVKAAPQPNQYQFCGTGEAPTP